MRHLVASMEALAWPQGLVVPTSRFRLLLIGDDLADQAAQVGSLAEEAYARGMVYCCCWGRGCEQTHDLVDQALLKVEKDFHSGRIVMTTWHNKHSLEDIAEYFTCYAQPSEELESDSAFWLALCFDKPKEARWIDKYLQTSECVYGSS